MGCAINDLVLFVDTLMTLTTDRSGATRGAADITRSAMVILCDSFAPREGYAGGGEGQYRDDKTQRDGRRGPKLADETHCG